MKPAEVSHTNSEFYVNIQGFIVHRSCVDEALQVVASPSLLQRIRMLSHHTQMVGHSGKHHVYNMLRCKFCWPYLTTNDERTDSECKICSWNSSKYRHKCNLQLFLAAGSLHFIAIDILVPFHWTTQHNQYVFTNTVRNSELIGKICMSKIASIKKVNLSSTVGLYHTAFLCISSKTPSLYSLPSANQCTSQDIQQKDNHVLA